MGFIGLALAGEYTPVHFQQKLEPREKEDSSSWNPPNYTQQDKALGYKEGVFAVPAGMEERVTFWIDIYTRYSTNQGILHDSRYMNLIYEVVDFSDIVNQANLTLRQIVKLKEQRVKTQKKEIRERLRRLQKLTSSAGLEGEDLRYWYLFNSIQEKNKFLEASQDGRLRFQLGQSDRFLEGIYHSGKYLKKMEDIFREEGVPVELTRLPFVESSFNYKARSRVGASGIWQFMPATARRYMKLNAIVDERNDPLRATTAAARKLRSNFNMLNSWPLAVTAYNRGPSGVRRLVKKYQTENIVELMDVRKGRFGFASANFYASFLAALTVEKNANTYFKNVLWAKPIEEEPLITPGSLGLKDLLSWFKGNLDLAKELNPHLRRAFWLGHRKLPAKNYVRIPPDQLTVARSFFRRSPAPSFAAKNQDRQAGGGLTAATDFGANTYKVLSGDTLSDIATQMGVKLSDLLQVNNMKSTAIIYVGQELVIPH